MSTPLLTAEELAAALQVSERTVLRWMSEGRISPEVHEERVLRFSQKRVLADLRKRAMRRSTSANKAETKPTMVPVL